MKNVNATEAEGYKHKQRQDKITDPDKADLTRSAIRAEQTITVSHMTRVPMMVSFLLPGLFHTEPKHSIFVNHLLRLTNGLQEIDPENHS